MAAQGFTDAVLPPIPGGTRSTSAHVRMGPAVGRSELRKFSFGPNLACNGSNLSPVALNILNLKLPNGQYYFPSSGANAPTNVALQHSRAL